jgi:hypothetical protein
VKKHLEDFHKRLEYRFRGETYIAWKMEFQKRGAPHFHALVIPPRTVDYWEYKELADLWIEIVLRWMERGAFGEKEKLAAKLGMEAVYYSTGSKGQFWRAVGDVGRYGWYLYKYMAKEHKMSGFDTMKVPATFSDPGRFWGVKRAHMFKPNRTSWIVSYSEYFRALERVKAEYGYTKDVLTAGVNDFRKVAGWIIEMEQLASWRPDRFDRWMDTEPWLDDYEEKFTETVP